MNRAQRRAARHQRPGPDASRRTRRQTPADYAATASIYDSYAVGTFSGESVDGGFIGLAIGDAKRASAMMLVCAHDALIIAEELRQVAQTLVDHEGADCACG